MMTLTIYALRKPISNFGKLIRSIVIKVFIEKGEGSWSLRREDDISRDDKSAFILLFKLGICREYRDIKQEHQTINDRNIQCTDGWYIYKCARCILVR